MVVIKGQARLMAAQALGRAQVLGTSAARMVAVGACFFMVSDSLLATDRFVQTLPMAQLWVLATYYAAQVLIVWGWLREQPPPPTDSTPRAGAPESQTAIPAAPGNHPAVATRAG